MRRGQNVELSQASEFHQHRNRNRGRQDFSLAVGALATTPLHPSCRHPPSFSFLRQQHRSGILIVESSSYQSKISTMASPEVHHLFHHPIADHSFSADRQTLAVARDTSVELYGRTGNGFKLKDELKGHDKMVTSVDIALQTGRIVTCSQGSYPSSGANQC
jgi:hypothetical protein